ncbi:uncharacterized protein LOC144578460 isoform X2 [Callithrix jacchus]
MTEVDSTAFGSYYGQKGEVIQELIERSALLPFRLLPRDDAARRPSSDGGHLSWPFQPPELTQHLSPPEDAAIRCHLGSRDRAFTRHQTRRCLHLGLLASRTIEVKFGDEVAKFVIWKNLCCGLFMPALCDLGMKECPPNPLYSPWSEFEYDKSFPFKL